MLTSVFTASGSVNSNGVVDLKPTDANTIIGYERFLRGGSMMVIQIILF